MVYMHQDQAINQVRSLRSPIRAARAETITNTPHTLSSSCHARLRYPSAMAPYTPTLIQHINLAVPVGTLNLATQFYGGVIGFGSDPVPQLQRDSLLW
jgi:hypothetical protein